MSPDDTRALFVWDDTVYGKIKASKTNVLGSTEDKTRFLDLLGRILKWEPAARMTMAEVLTHPFFRTENGGHEKSLHPCRQEPNQALSAMLARTFSANNDKQAWDILWRNEFEKQHLVKAVEKWHLFYWNKQQDSSVEKVYVPLKSWLLHDIVLICKKVVEKLRSADATFDIQNIARWCCVMFCFIWDNSWIPAPELESAIFHIIHLVDFVGFPLDVRERELTHAVTTCSALHHC
jgi:hypothetical protein